MAASDEETLWQYESLSEELLSGLNNLRESGDLFDVTVIIGGRPFKAHKAVLASLSSYFQVMFTNQGFVDSSKSEIEIKDKGLSSESFDKLLSFMYSGKIHMDDIQTAVDVLHIAGFLQVKSAIQLCVNYLTKITQEKDVPFETAYTLSSVANQLDQPDLKDSMDRYTGQHLVAFSETTEFLTQMTAPYLEELLLREDLNQTSSEEEILQVIIEWLKYDWEDRKGHAEDLLGKVRLATIPMHAISDIVSVINDDIESMAQNIRKDDPKCTHRGTVNEAFCDIGYEMKLELGHRHIHTSQEEVNSTVVFVQGPENARNIKQYVDKVVFMFSPEAKDAPFEATTSVDDESVAVVVHFKNLDEPKKFAFRYTLSPDINSIRSEKVTFWKPREDFRNTLLDAGAVVVEAREASFQVTEIGVEKQGFRNATFYDCQAFEDLISSCIANSSVKRSSIHPTGEHSRSSLWYEDGVEEEEDVDFGNASHKILTNVPKFLIAKNNGERIHGWRLAKHAEVTAGLKLVKPHLHSRSWYICRLEGGKVAGSGYHYEMDTADHSTTLGHRLMIKYPREFSVTHTGKLVPGWRLANCNEVESNSDMILALLKGKKSQYEYLVQGGKICRQGSELHTKHGSFMGLEYQLIVRGL